MSRFAADFAASGLPSLMFQHGQPALYNPVNQPSVSLTAMVEQETREVGTQDGFRVVMRKKRATITDDPDSTFGGVTAANEAATMTIDEEEWSIENVSRGTAAWYLDLTRPELAEQARPGYRGQA